jgi:hypothetical protein
MLRTLVFAALSVLPAAGCSDIGFPAVHDMPAARSDTMMTPDEVKQATDDLVTQRDHLQSIPPATGPTPAPQKASMQTTGSAPATTGSTQTTGAANQP